MVNTLFFANLRALLSLLLRSNSITRRSYGASLIVRHRLAGMPLSEPEAIFCRTPVPSNFFDDVSYKCRTFAEMSFCSRNLGLDVTWRHFLQVRVCTLASCQVEMGVGSLKYSRTYMTLIEANGQAAALFQSHDEVSLVAVLLHGSCEILRNGERRMKEVV